MYPKRIPQKTGLDLNLYKRTFRKSDYLRIILIPKINTSISLILILFLVVKYIKIYRISAFVRLEKWFENNTRGHPTCLVLNVSGSPEPGFPKRINTLVNVLTDNRVHRDSLSIDIDVRWARQIKKTTFKVLYFIAIDLQVFGRAHFEFGKILA